MEKKSKGPIVWVDKSGRKEVKHPNGKRKVFPMGVRIVLWKAPDEYGGWDGKSLQLHKRIEESDYGWIPLVVKT